SKPVTMLKYVPDRDSVRHIECKKHHHPNSSRDCKDAVIIQHHWRQRCTQSVTVRQQSSIS
ncbi:MAG: hypothetical protein MK299_10975, partial [Pseudomonadales bacterium]|nr:hypothetical protein [Pseudomonadales bacterium]